PVRLARSTLGLYSCATHVIEWHALPQNSLVPVAATMPWVAITPPAPTITPTTTSASTDHLALGVVSHAQARPAGPRERAFTSGFPATVFSPRCSRRSSPH